MLPMIKLGTFTLVSQLFKSVNVTEICQSITHQKCWRCPRTCTTAIFSISDGATCTQCVPLFTCTPTYPLTRAYSVHPGPCNGNPRPTSSTSVSFSCYIICDSYIMFHGAPLVMVTESQQAWSFWSSFC